MLNRITLSPEDLCGDNNNEINLNDEQNRLELLTRNQKGIGRKIDTLLDLIGEKSIDKETFSSRYEPLIVQRDSVLQEIPRLQGEIDYIKGEELGRESVAVVVKGVVAFVSNAKPLFSTPGSLDLCWFWYG